MFIKIITLLLPFITLTAGFGQDSSVTLRYLFKQGEAIQYKTESHDSMRIDMGGHFNTMKFTRHAIHTLIAIQTPPDNPYKIKVIQDTSWTDSDLGGGSTNNRRGNMRIRNEDEILTMTALGKASGRGAVVSPFILPLPEQPISINDIWEFNIEKKLQGRMKGSSTIKGICQVYDLTATTAVILVTLDIETNSKFSGNFNGRAISMTTHALSKGTQAVYFNYIKGRIEEIVSEITEESTSEGMRSGNRINVSKTTIRLIE
ncbi:hypothetical protein KAR48_16985 [bacterium]|nr:hypothetical protein [bacterium]